MADTSTTLRASAAAQLGRPSVARLIVGYGAIACAVPYLALKIIWLSGGRLGVADAGMMRDASMVALNGVTAGMDLVAIAIALAFTHPWGLRLPAWLVLPPMWVASGLLVKFVAGVPVTAIADALASDSVPRPVAGPVQPWVYTVVYTEFTGMGIGLMLAFLMYARTRWSSVLRSTTQGAQPGATHGVQVPLAGVAALMAVVVGGVRLAWAFGSTVGLGSALVARRTISSYLIEGIDAAMALMAAAGALMVVYRFGRRVPFWVPVTMAWLGGGSLFAWGMWHLVNVLGNTAPVRDHTREIVLLNFVSLLGILAGLVIGLVTVLLLAEQQAARTTSQ